MLRQTVPSMLPNHLWSFGKTAPTGEITDSVSFCEHLLKGVKVAAVPGIGFGEDSCMRLSYASSEDNIAKASDA